MLLTRLKAQGFRSLKQVEISFDRLTLLIGGNDTGKSSILDLLDIVLNDETLDADDFHHPPGEDEPVDAVEVILEFRLGPDGSQEVLQYALGDVLKIRKVYRLDGEKTYYWAEYPEDKRLRRNNFERDLKAAEQKELIRAFDASALDDLSNKQERAEWLREYAQNAPQKQGWKEVPKRGWGGFLPRFYRYSAMDYDDPGDMILNTLRQVFNSVVYEDEDSQQLIADLEQVQDKAEVAINEKVAELRSYVRKYNDQVQDISYDPIIDFSRGLRAGQFQIDDGRGFHYLSKTGDGTKRRMFIATLDWDREVTLEQAAQDVGLPPVIRGYDEPDTNLDYGAQRTMCQSISSIVEEEKTRTQAILCTHSPPMINRVPAQHIRLLSLCDGCTKVEQLETGDDPEVEAFLRDSARELGITNTLMFYERCFVLIEGETEENALPILYRKIYGHSLLEDGIQPINVKGNGAVKEFLRLLSRNRQELTIIFVDDDTNTTDEADLTEETLRSAGFDDDCIDERLLYIGDQEFEDAFSDAVIARCLQKKWPKSEGEWGPGDIEPLREQDKKFSDALWEDLVCQYTKQALRSSWSKPVFGKELARCCSEEEIPEAILKLFETARIVAKCE
jgi:predicted ATP-binding protein involved in virulence